MVNWVFILSFLFSLSASTAATYIFTALTCTTTRVSLEPCTLNVEFQHFVLSCSSISYWDLTKTSLLLCEYSTTEKWDWGVKGGGPKTGWRESYFFMDNSSNPFQNTCMDVSRWSGMCVTNTFRPIAIGNMSERDNKRHTKKREGSQRTCFNESMTHSLGLFKGLDFWVWVLGNCTCGAWLG